MFSFWSMLNSSLADECMVLEKLEKNRDIFKSPMSGYFKPFDNAKTKKDDPRLKKNEQDFIKRISPYLNLDEEICSEIYLGYLKSPFNQFIVSSDLLEKLQAEELFSAHFYRLVDFYHRERYCFLKNVILIISSLVENSALNYDLTRYQWKHLDGIKDIFKIEDILVICNSAIKDYGQICKEIRTTFSANKKQLVEISSTYSMIKYLNSLQYLQSTINVDKITSLQALIVVKCCRLASIMDPRNDISLEQKSQLINTDTRDQINELIQSFGSNYKASPVILAWSTLLYNFSIDPILSKTFTNEMNTLINRMYGLAIKENVFANLLSMLASNQFENHEVLWHIKQILYELFNGVLNSFDDNSLGDNLKLLFELCFFCMHKNEIVCEKFWTLCKLPDRENITILLFYAMETFPVSFVLTLTFFSLICKTNPEMCKQTFEYLGRMDQFCEYFDNLSMDEYVTNGESVRLIKNRRLFDGFNLNIGVKGVLLGNSATSNVAHRMILSQQAITWTVNYNGLDLISNYFSQINQAASQNDLSGENNIIAIVQLVDSLFKYFFETSELYDDDYAYQMNTRYMNFFADSCLELFTNLMNMESTYSHRLLAKLFELFNNISAIYPQILNRLIPLLEYNNLIGNSEIYNKMNLQEIFNNRFNLVNSSKKQLFLLKSQDYDLIINYFKLIENLIKINGNSLKYMSPLCCVLVLIFPQIHKWKSNTFKVNLDMSITCLNLLHSVLNQNNYSRSIDSPSNRVSIDRVCEMILLNSECSNSLLSLISNAYECGQASDHLNEIKKLDEILIQSVSLLNRLISAPTSSPGATEVEKIQQESVIQSLMYSLLIKSISQQNQSSLIASGSNLHAPLSESDVHCDQTIAQNNQFLFQLNLMMSQTTASNELEGNNRNATANSKFLTETASNKSEINWFHLLVKLAKHKSKSIMDCLLFSLFKKIAQLTPRLFGSLLGPYTSQMHEILLSKLKFANGGQVISSVCEFLCSLIENQPGFFQTLAALKFETATDRCTDDSRSVLKAMADLLNELKNNKDSQDYYVSVSGILSVFYGIWSNRKEDYMNYFRQKNEFWHILGSTLHIIRKDDLNQEYVDEENDEVHPYRYLEYFGFDSQIYENEMLRFDELILESNIKCVSYSFKIFSLEIFDFVYLKKAQLSSQELPKILNDVIFGKHLVEKWIEFYKYQLKRDLAEERETVLNRVNAMSANIDNQIVNVNISILDPNGCAMRKSDSEKSLSMPDRKHLKSKTLFDSIKMLLLLINKTNRLANGANNNTLLVEQMSMRKFQLDSIFDSMNSSIMLIVDHFLYLNNLLLTFQRDQKMFKQEYEEPGFVLESRNNKKGFANILKNDDDVVTSSNFITLKQSNEVLKQFHSITNTLMVLVTSIKNSNEEYVNKLVKDLIFILEKIILDDFNYFPTVVNSIETSILHLITSNKAMFLDILKNDEQLMKKFVSTQCKIFEISSNNLEDEVFQKSGLLKDCTITLILNVDLLKFTINNIDAQYWNGEILERCTIYRLYNLFEKHIKSYENSEMVNSILEMFFTFAKIKIDYLAESDFNTRTCLLVNKLFEYSFCQLESPMKKIKLNNEVVTKWSQVLRLYVNIQSLMLTKLKYNYLKDSLLFFGTYYETMVQIIFNLDQTLNNDLLETIRAILRYLSQISLYKREMLINLSNSMDSLERIFCSLFQLCISKLATVKHLMLKMQQQTLQLQQQQQQQQQQLQPSLQQNQLVNAQIISNKTNIEELVISQNLLFSITSLCLDSLLNYIPNFGESNYMARLDEYKLLLAIQLSPPSSFDLHSSLSFGSILWLIDYILKILHRYETLSTTLPSNPNATKTTVSTPNKRVQDILNDQQPNVNETSPKKNLTVAFDENLLEIKYPTKSLIVSVLEKVLNLLLTQIIICDRQINFTPRDKKIFKRELSSEINSIIHGLSRTFKRTNSSQYPTKSPTAASSSQSNISSSNWQAASSLFNSGSKQTYDFFKCIHNVLQQNVINT